MRIRSTKPEFWRSNRIAAVSWEARFVLKGLESYVDDNGVGKDDHELIVGDLFSRDLVREPSGTLKRVQVAVDELFRAGLIHRYQSDGTNLLYIAWWESAQYINRPTKGRFPRPDGTSNYGESKIGESAPESSRALKSVQEPSIPNQGNRGTGEQVNPTTLGEESPTDGSAHTPAQKLVAEWLRARKDNRPNKQIIGQVSKQVKNLVDEGVLYEHVQAGLINWHRKGDLHPSVIPSMVDAVANGKTYQEDPAPLKPWTAEPPPVEIVDDPEACERWYREQAAKREAS